MIASRIADFACTSLQRARPSSSRSTHPSLGSTPEGDRSRVALIVQGGDQDTVTANLGSDRRIVSYRPMKGVDDLSGDSWAASNKVGSLLAIVLAQEELNGGDVLAA